MKFEDFSPINSTEALQVCGPSYNNLNEIQLVKYHLKHWGHIEMNISKVLQKGTYLRLGNYYSGELVYSDNYDVFRNGKFICEGIQPYMFDKGLLYQHHGVIFLNDEILIRPPPTSNYYVVGRPTYAQGKVFYETRNNDFTHWEIWTFDFSTNMQKFLIKGANPFMYNNTLFYQTWNEKSNEFDLEYKEYE